MKKGSDEFLTIRPKNDLVKKHIEYYYFHKSDDKDFNKRIIYYPHYVTALNIYKNVEIFWNESGRVYTPTNSNQLSITLTNNIKTNKTINLQGEFDKIGIIFKPLGINNFITEPLSNIISDRVVTFNYFGESFKHLSNQIYGKKTCDEKRDLLDTFFLNKYHRFADERLILAVSIIMDSNKILLSRDIATRVGVSRETLLRIFKKHLGYTVEEFKTVVKFRRAMSYYESKVLKPKLTAVALANGYYDQADFIKHFNAITGFNPKKFFLNIDTVSSEGTSWTFINE